MPNTRYFLELRAVNASGVSDAIRRNVATRIFEPPRDLSAVEWSDDSHPDYQVKVRAVNAAGVSEPSILAFKTRVRAPTHLRFSQRNVDLLPGTHSFEVWAMDLSGNASDPAALTVFIIAANGESLPLMGEFTTK